jgi:hypothetical protein
MTREPVADIPDVVPVPGRPTRTRVVVRKRRSRKVRNTPQWSASASRARMIRIVALSTGVLLLMAGALCAGLSYL